MKAILSHIEKRGFNKGIGIFLITYQLLFITCLPLFLYFGTFQLSTFLVGFVLYFLTGLGITAGYHRLYSHKSYKANSVVEAIIVFFGTLATQGSVIRWSFDHRLHHAYVDSDDDPYSIKNGFWYAHFLWLLEKPRTIQPKVVADLLQNRLLAFQHTYYLPIVIGLNALVFLFFGWILNDYWGSFFFVLWGRMFALHHSTWFINSLAHTWGDKPFSQEHSAVNNYLISLVTFGEGYHNYHHTFANDYRNGICWYHFDCTKWLIWGLSLFGLTTQLKKIDAASIKKRMVIEHKKLLMERLKDLWDIKRDELASQIESLSEELIQKLNKLSELKSNLNMPESNELFKSMKQELKQLRQSIKSDWYAWKRLSNYILTLRPS